MEYIEITQAEYKRLAANLIMHTEAFEARAYDLRDGAATIGFGYTFNRANNVELWERANIQLDETQRRHLERIDAATTNAERTRLGLRFARALTREEARDLLELASIPEYEDPANSLGMPYSKERAVLVSVTYNRGQHAVRTRMEGFAEAIREGDRAEAWYQLRYNSWGSNPGAERGLRKRRGMEAAIFGLYDDPANISPEEALSVYGMFQLHRDSIRALESAWGVSFEGVPSRLDVIGLANRDYRELLLESGPVPTINAALEPAKRALLHGLRGEFPEVADRLDAGILDATAIHVDPGRQLRLGDRLTVAQRNSTSERVDTDRAHALDGTVARAGVEVGRNDLLLGMGGDDTLVGGRGHDILIGGADQDQLLGGVGFDTYLVDSGDVVRDEDGLGQVHWDGKTLGGGAQAPADPEGIYRSSDGCHTYQLDGTDLLVTLQGGAAIRVAGFDNGNLGISLDPGNGQDVADLVMYHEVDEQLSAANAEREIAEPASKLEQVTADVLRDLRCAGMTGVTHVRASVGCSAGKSNPEARLVAWQGDPRDPATRWSVTSVQDVAGVDVDEILRQCNRSVDRPGQSPELASLQQVAPRHAGPGAP
ncbi:XVIPCD domain-containing protein [Luteimonas sp. MC1825]|uniref:glycoside hydrolase family protein n=1 Tax=Luteimonas sp. MC1825 TaxID=2761107 RepID=UPI001CC790A8|nr:XVIPCD domain-containing protein [Luteimonas sp. MC1825]